MDYINVSSEIRDRYGDDLILESHLARINSALRMFEQSLLGRNMKVNFGKVYIAELPQ